MEGRITIAEYRVRRDKLEGELPTDDEEELDEYEGSDAQLEDIDNHILDIQLEQVESMDINAIRLNATRNPDFKHISNINT